MPTAMDPKPFSDWLHGRATSHNALGDAYFALGLTSVTGHTAKMRRDEKAAFGSTIHDTALETPVPGSVEAAFADAGLGLASADLRRARAENLSGLRSTPASTVTELEKP
ncbi:erythromycin esterase family protein [Streptomyces sp. NPDC058221]|uniref:erythromycin esterase family protein n=1 Tax=Streptomyces sp. NPDC058221 TaxID=3346388 RepID=UPI0036EF8A64